jgi:hypothetical protein
MPFIDARGCVRRADCPASLKRSRRRFEVFPCNDPLIQGLPLPRYSTQRFFEVFWACCWFAPSGSCPLVALRY